MKWDTYGGKDVIPLWVADMDLKTSPAITDAVKERVDHGIFGYSFPTEGVKAAVMKYYKASRRRSFLQRIPALLVVSQSVPVISDRGGSFGLVVRRVPQCGIHAY